VITVKLAFLNKKETKMTIVKLVTLVTTWMKCITLAERKLVVFLTSEEMLSVVLQRT
jgi:hypothetical protein